MQLHQYLTLTVSLLDVLLYQDLKQIYEEAEISRDLLQKEQNLLFVPVLVRVIVA